MGRGSRIGRVRGQQDEWEQYALTSLCVSPTSFVRTLKEGRNAKCQDGASQGGAK